MQLSEDYKESLLDQGIDVRQRLVWINEEISNKTFRKVSKAISLMSTDKPVTILINSEGGDYYDSLAIVDYIRNSKAPIYTVGYGKVMSGALLILVAGMHRSVGKNCWMLYHNSLYEEEGNHKDVKASVAQSEQEELQSAALMAEYTKKPEQFWKEIADTKDFYFTAERAMELGVIDAIKR